MPSQENNAGKMDEDCSHNDWKCHKAIGPEINAIDKFNVVICDVVAPTHRQALGLSWDQDLSVFIMN